MSRRDLARVEPVEAIPARYQNKAAEYLESELADNTRAAYGSAVRSFLAWCKAEGRAPMPASPGTVIGYVTHLAESGRPWSSINQALSAIARLHEDKGLDNPRDGAAVRRVCKGIRRVHGTAPKNKKAAILRDDLATAVGSLPDSPIGRRDRAILLLGFACALRREELSELDTGDLAFTPKGMTVAIKSSKTDAEGKGEVLGVPREAEQTISAVRLWRKGLLDGPLFPRFSLGGERIGSRISPQGVGRVVVRALERAGLIPDIPRKNPGGPPRRRSHGAHSLRAGFITQARLDGKTLDEIMTQSRHESVAVARGYIRHVDVFEANAARGVAL